ncbi:MAG: SRPBCC family protein [Kineosporiaceae bacterium]
MMFDARTTEFIRTTAEEFLEFVLDVERYQQIDEKIRPVLWVRREQGFTEFAFRPRIGPLRSPTWVSQERLVDGRRVDIQLAPAPYNRFARLIIRYEASFECEPAPGGVLVSRSERFRMRGPLRWIVEPAVRRMMPRLVREELRLAKQLLEAQAPAGG